MTNQWQFLPQPDFLKNINMIEHEHDKNMIGIHYVVHSLVPTQFKTKHLSLISSSVPCSYSMFHKFQRSTNVKLYCDHN